MRYSPMTHDTMAGRIKAQTSSQTSASMAPQSTPEQGAA